MQNLDLNFQIVDFCEIPFNLFMCVPWTQTTQISPLFDSSEKKLKKKNFYERQNWEDSCFVEFVFNCLHVKKKFWIFL